MLFLLLPINDRGEIQRKKVSVENMHTNIWWKRSGGRVYRVTEYLLPSDKLIIEDQRKIFPMRQKDGTTPANYPSKKENKTKCTSCEEYEDTEHVYIC